LHHATCLIARTLCRFYTRPAVTLLEVTPFTVPQLSIFSLDILHFLF